MGWQDRDYSDESYSEAVSTSRVLRRPPNGTLALMVLHAAAFLVMLVLPRMDGQSIATLLVLQGAGSQPLGIVLHPLATAEVLRAIFVVLALWSLGGRLEPRLGTGRFLAMYLAGNWAAGLAYFGLGRILPGLATAALDYPVGAFAALCVAAWQFLRHDAVQVLGHVTSLAKVYAICAAIVIVLVLVGAREGAVVWLIAALAGAGSALLAERWRLRGKRCSPRARRAIRPSIPQAAIPPPSDEPDIDDILAKISREGLGSLTTAERARLEAARRAKLRRSR